MKLDLSDLRRVNVARAGYGSEIPIESWKIAWIDTMYSETGYLRLLEKINSGDEIEIAREMAHILINLDLLAWRLGIDLEKAVISKAGTMSDLISFPPAEKGP